MTSIKGAPVDALDFATGRDGDIDFFQYGDAIGFFDSLSMILPPKFYILFEIARTILTQEVEEAMSAVEEITKDEKIYEPDRDEAIQVNRVDRSAPLSDKMEIETYRTINDLKKALPRELAQDDDIFDAKLFTKTLMVQKFFESEADSFKPISTTQDDRGRGANKFEQKFYILFDRSRSMELKFRAFYAKCLVAEFLRRKLNSRAKLYYRGFDSELGELYTIEKPEDFPDMIENVLLTTTGGSSTNIQAAVFQAIKDIEYDKEMLNSEIVVVTDGASKIDKFEMKKRLGNIRLNILKIGDEFAEADYYDLKQNMDAENIDFDPTSVNMKNAQKELAAAKNENGESTIPLSVQRAYRLILDHSDRVFKDLKDISYKYIELGDLPQEGLFVPDQEQVDSILQTVKNFQKIDLGSKSLAEMQKLYKQIYFFSQYLEQLMQSDSSFKSQLESAFEDLVTLKQKLLKNPELFYSLRQVKELVDDKKLMKLAKKEARKMLKEMQLSDKKLSVKEMKKAQMIFTMDVGEGSMGQFILLLFIKLFQGIKKIVTFPFKGKEKREGEK